MPQYLNVFALPKLADPQELVGGVAVVIDVLRSTTTILHALEAGAREVIPCAEVDEARAIAAQFPPDEVVLGGERQGVAIKGFDLDNSPENYTPDCVQGKTVVFTSTNGTLAMVAARPARRILLGSFLNASAICEQLLGEERIHLICSGTNGEFSEDDILLAGMLADRLQRLGGGMAYQENVQSLTARELWKHWFALPQSLGAEPIEPERLAQALYESPGGRNLAALGLDEDILAASQVDQFRGVPELDPETFRIRLTK
jgi:2-phosphosulfolactate phosphatase